MNAAEINKIVDNAFGWILGILCLLYMMGAFDERPRR